MKDAVLKILFDRTFSAQSKSGIIYPFPKDKILDWSKLKAFAEDKIKVIKMMVFVFDRVENIVEKGKNAGNQHFLLSPQCFQRAFYPGFSKVGIVL